jgi:hypothetical protein
MRSLSVRFGGHTDDNVSLSFVLFLLLPRLFAGLFSNDALSALFASSVDKSNLLLVPLSLLKPLRRLHRHRLFFLVFLSMYRILSPYPVSTWVLGDVGICPKALNIIA